MGKHCNSCKKPAAASPCAECSEKHKDKSGKRELFVSHNGGYGYRLIAGFNLMRYIEDEWAERKDY